MAQRRVVCGNCHLCGSPFGYRYNGTTSEEFHCNCKAYQQGNRTKGRQGARVEGDTAEYTSSGRAFRSTAFEDRELHDDPIPSRGRTGDDPNVIDLGVARVIGPRNVADGPMDDTLRALGWEGALYLRDRERWAVDSTVFITQPLAVKYRNYRMQPHRYGLWYQPCNPKQGVYQPEQGFIDSGNVLWTAGSLRTDFQVDVMYEHAKRKFVENGAEFEIATGNRLFRQKIYERAMRDGLRLHDADYLAFVKARMQREIDRQMQSAAYGF